MQTAALTTSPWSIVHSGVRVYKRFDGGLFLGRLEEYDEHNQTWTLHYDTQDEFTEPPDFTYGRWVPTSRM